MNGYAQLATTTSTKADAERVASAALEARRAACVQIVGPIESRYWWEGKLEVAEEWLCLLKTAARQVDSLMATVRAVHPYDTPEITVTLLAGGDDRYLAWIDAETDSDDDRTPPAEAQGVDPQ
jgi:periplasmic divalent cation tolerance protein